MKLKSNMMKYKSKYWENTPSVVLPFIIVVKYI